MGFPQRSSADLPSVNVDFDQMNRWTVDGRQVDRLAWPNSSTCRLDDQAMDDQAAFFL